MFSLQAYCAKPAGSYRGPQVGNHCISSVHEGACFLETPRYVSQISKRWKQAIANPSFPRIRHINTMKEAQF